MVVPHLLTSIPIEDGSEDWADDVWSESDDEALRIHLSSPLPASSDAGLFSSPIAHPSAMFNPLDDDNSDHNELPRPPSPGIFATPERSSGAGIASISSFSPMTPIAQLLRNEGIVPSSAVVGSRSTRKAKRMKKARNRQRIKVTQIEWAKRGKSEVANRQACDRLLRLAKAKGIRWVDLMTYVFNPELGQGNTRYHEFFVLPGAVRQVLDWWMSSKNSPTARREVAEWAVEYVASCVAKEARKVTESGELQTMKKAINRELVNSFELSNYTEKLATDWAPTASTIISAFATSRHAGKHKDQRLQKTALVRPSQHRSCECANQESQVKTMVSLMCLGEYSRANNLVKRLMGLYLYSAGAQRQTINVLSKIGLSESYSSLISSRVRRLRKAKTGTSSSQPDLTSTSPGPNEAQEGQRLGTLYQLSDSVRNAAREIAATGQYGIVYDNINLNFSNSEQILGRHGASQFLDIKQSVLT